MSISTKERLQTLEETEQLIPVALMHAGQALAEFGRDKPNLKQVDNHAQNFLKTLEKVEEGLTKHINYLTQVSTGQPHTGSSYAAQKDLQMAFHRLEHVRSRLADLERMKNDHQRARQQQVMPRSTSITMETAPPHPAAPQRSTSQQDPMQGLQRNFSMTDSSGMQRSYSQPDGGH